MNTSTSQSPIISTFVAATLAAQMAHGAVNVLGFGAKGDGVTKEVLRGQAMWFTPSPECRGWSRAGFLSRKVRHAKIAGVMP